MTLDSTTREMLQAAALQVCTVEVIECGGDATDVLDVVEHIVAGAVFAITHNGGDEAMLATLMAQARRRLAQARFASSDTVGSA